MNLHFLSSSSSITYSLSGNLNDLNTFEIEPNSGAIHLVSKLNKALKSTYKLNVVAHSVSSMPVASATVELNIQVEDESSERPPPSFTQPFYEFLVSEPREGDYTKTSIGRVRAFPTTNANPFSIGLASTTINRTEPDIEYAIDFTRSSGVAELPFRIESRDGRIFVERHVYKGMKPVYEFYVTAKYLVDKSAVYSVKNASSSIVKVKIRVF